MITPDGNCQQRRENVSKPAVQPNRLPPLSFFIILESSSKLK
jgi:hypothetical protein